MLCLSKVEPSILDTFKVFRVNSVSQKIINKNEIILEGDVDILVDSSIHLWADKVIFNKETNILEACSKTGIVFEQDEVLIIADNLSLNIATKTGSAQNVRVHLKDGYLYAKEAEKVNNDTWHFKHVAYTACDHTHPHWKITVPSVWMKKNIVYLYNLPLFKVPLLVATAQPQTSSGFLIPRMSYNKHFGMGIIQQYYWDISPTLDSTFGINWKDKKGFVLFDELRQISGKDEYSLLNTQYARDNEFKKNRFWFTGKNFNTIKLPNLELNNLLRIDFGTDKHIGYDFFFNVDAIEDNFLNSFISRNHNKLGVVSLSFDQEKLFRNKFFFINSQKFKIEDNFKVSRAYHLEWNSSYLSITDSLFYKNNIFIDQIFSRERSFDTYFNANSDLLPYNQLDTARAYYEGSLNKQIKFRNNNFKFKINPNFQIRSRLDDINAAFAKMNVIEKRFSSEGVYRFFIKAGAEWAFPEMFSINKNYSYYFQPIFKWNYVPKFKQEHWNNSDIWDREYAKNEISFSVRNSWNFEKVRFELISKLASDFNNRTDLFFLRRNAFTEHLLPLQLQLNFDSDNLRLTISQDYDLRTGTLLESAINTGVSFRESYFYSSLVYQNPTHQKSCEFLSDIPAFVNLGFKIPIYKNMHMHYNSNFYSTSNSFFGVFRNSDALLHRLRFQYAGHCWSTSFGFEEKRFRQDGNVKSEQSYFLSFKLDSLGSLAYNLKKEPEILKAPLGY